MLKYFWKVILCRKWLNTVTTLTRITWLEDPGRVATGNHLGAAEGRPLLRTMQSLSRLLLHCSAHGSETEWDKGLCFGVVIALL